MYFPQMIINGMIYKATPPLYATKVNGKDKCFIDNLELISYNQKLFSQKYQMSTPDKKLLGKNELKLFFLRNQDFLYWLKRLARTFALEPSILEDILDSYVGCNCTVNFAKLQKVIRSKYRFMDVEKAGDTCIVTGSNIEANTIPLADRFLNACKPLIDIIKSNDYLYYFIDGKKLSIYEIMVLYDKVQPGSIDRFKGLGETNNKLLEKFVMNPLADRVLYQYTIDDLKEAMATVREYESDKKKILSLVGNITRDDLVD